MNPKCIFELLICAICSQTRTEQVEWCKCCIERNELRDPLGADANCTSNNCFSWDSCSCLAEYISLYYQICVIWSVRDLYECVIKNLMPINLHYCAGSVCILELYLINLQYLLQGATLSVGLALNFVYSSQIIL